MKLPYATLTKILMDQIYNTYLQVRAAQRSDSDGGKKVTRQEVWDLVTNFMLNTGSQMENLISLNNGLNYNVKFRWAVVTIIVKSLNELPEELEAAKADDGEISRAEAIKIISNILKNAIPDIIDLTDDRL